MDVFTPGIHGSTYGGNPLACAVAIAALDVLVEEKLIERAAELGVHLDARLKAIRSPLVKETRCLGLWAGVELVPEAGGARKYCYALKDRGLLCKDTHVNTIRLAPPARHHPRAAGLGGGPDRGGAGRLNGRGRWPHRGEAGTTKDTRLGRLLGLGTGTR